ncbi:MAG: SNF2-related protein [bacterium]
MSIDREYFGLFMEMRTGKTKTIIDTACALALAGSLNALVVVAPKGVFRTWTTDQLPTHLWPSVNARVETWRAGAGVKLMKRYNDLIGHKGLAVFVVNIESIDTKKCEAFLSGFLKSRRALLAVDESACIKNPQANCTKAALRLAALAPYRRILTGTPVTQGPLDLYSQLEFLKPGASGMRSFYAFKSMYAIEVRTNIRVPGAFDKAGNPRMRTFNKTVGYRNAERLKTRLDALSFTVKLADVRADLPPKIYQTVEVPLTEGHANIYKYLAKHCVMKLEGEVVVSAPMALTLLTKLHQCATGFVIQDDGRTLDLSGERVQALMDLITRCPGKAVVFAAHQHSIESIGAALRMTYGQESTVLYYGPTPEGERDVARYRFQHETQCRFFVGTQATAGEALDLSAANVVVYYSNTFSLRHRLQSEARPMGPAQHDPVLVVDLVAPSTVDVKIVDALKTKQSIADQLTGAGWRSFLEN